MQERVRAAANMAEQLPAATEQRNRFNRRNLLRAAAAVGAGTLISGGSIAAWEAWLRDPVLRATSPDLRMIPPAWVERSDSGQIHWASFAPSGDPSVTSDQRTWKQIGVVLSPVAELHEMLRQAGEGAALEAMYQTGATTARATAVGSVENLGIFNGGELGDKKYDDYAAIGFIIGTGALNATLGVRAQDGSFKTSPYTQPYMPADSLTLHTLPHELPNVPVLRRQPV